MLLRRFNVERRVTDPAIAHAMMLDGFVIIQSDKTAEPTENPKPDYDSMLKKELVSIAQANGVAGAKNFTKAELIEILEDK